jgi:hypothetical protein
VPRDVAGLDLMVSTASPGATSSAKSSVSFVSFVLLRGRWARFCQQHSSGVFVVSVDVARRDVIDGISYLGVDGLAFVGSTATVSQCRGASLGATSSAESLVVPWDVAVLDVG